MPVIGDDTGYLITAADLAAVGLSSDDLQAMQRQERPLGMTPASFAFFCRSLVAALHEVGAVDADVRLQGSAAWLFSAPHKAMPCDRDSLMTLIVQRQRGRVPHSFELDDIEERLDAMWPAGAVRPGRPFFDLLHLLRIDPVPSDVDVQISSDALVAKAQQLAQDRGVSLEALQTVDPHYRFLTDGVVDAIAWPLQHWADDQSAVHGRLVALKVFVGSGPPDVRTDPTAVTSSHFVVQDWVLRPGTAAAP